MKSFSLPKFIFYVLTLGIILNAIKMYYAQTNMAESVFEQTYGWYYKLEFYGNVLVSVAAILSFILYHKYFPVFVTVCYISLVLLVILCSINDFAVAYKKPSFIYTIRGIGTFVNFGIIYFAANTGYFKKLLKVFYYMCFGFFIAGIINLSKVGIGASRLDYLYAIRDFTVILIWIFPFFFLQNEPSKRMNMINMAAFALLFIFVLSTGSRSYLIIYVIYLVTKFKEQLRSKNALLVIFGTLIIGVGAYLLIINSDLGKPVEGAFNILAERSNEDSRSGQILEFINQWDTDYLIQGVGPIKEWYWTNVMDYYYFLDNQFLLMGWWAGLPALFIYMYLLIRTYFLKPEVLLFEDVKGKKLLIGLWILACLGFAIYITISSSLYYYFLDIIMGYHLCKFTLLQNPDFEEA